MTRIIAHLDMDAYFASIEQQCNPGLRGKPIAVTGKGNRTIVTTSSYEARAFGVRTGMNKYEAKAKCPHIIFVEANNSRYTDTCKWFVNLCRKFTPTVEVFSIDEVFLDLTGSIKLFGPAKQIITEIRKTLLEQKGITFSAGIGPNKLVAKLLSDMKKPNGLTEITKKEIPELLGNLPVSTLCGIGKKTEKKLLSLGIQTCGELGKADPAILRRYFGITGNALVQMGQGKDNRPVVPVEEAPSPCSVGHSTTFDHDISSKEILKAQMLRLSEMVGRRARERNFSGKTIALTIRYKDFTTFTKQISLQTPINKTRDINAVSDKILESINLTQSVRLLGISLSNLVNTPKQLELFTEEKKQQQLTYAMDKVNSKFGDFTLTWGSLMPLENRAKIISPAWRPEGPRKIEF
jgi:DNA polymerase-4